MLCGVNCDKLEAATTFCVEFSFASSVECFTGFSEDIIDKLLFSDLAGPKSTAELGGVG